MSSWAVVGAGHLGLPEPPAPLAAQLEDLGDGRVGTRPHAHAFRGIGWFLDEAEQGRADEYVLAGIETVSTELDALHYFLVYGPVALFVQAEINDDGLDRLRTAGEVTASAVTSAAAGVFPSRMRLVVLDSFLTDRRWALIGPDAEDEPWRMGGVHAAAAWLDTLQP